MLYNYLKGTNEHFSEEKVFILCDPEKDLANLFCRILQIYFVTYKLSTLEIFTLHFEDKNDFYFNGY